jgi:hypothetical protein
LEDRNAALDDHNVALQRDNDTLRAGKFARKTKK